MPSVESSCMSWLWLSMDGGSGGGACADVGVGGSAFIVSRASWNWAGDPTESVEESSVGERLAEPDQEEAVKEWVWAVRASRAAGQERKQMFAELGPWRYEGQGGRTPCCRREERSAVLEEREDVVGSVAVCARSRNGSVWNKGLVESACLGQGRGREKRVGDDAKGSVSEGVFKVKRS